MLKFNETKIRTEHLDDYAKCSVFAKYNWNYIDRHKKSYLYTPIKEIIVEAYSSQSNLEKKIAWKTIRNRTHQKLVPVILENKSVKNYFSLIKTILGQLRGWYLSMYRDGPTTCLTSLQLESQVPATGLQITATIDVILLAPDEISIIEITDKYKNPFEITNSISLRSKVWLLHKQGIKVDKISVISIRNGDISIHQIQIKDHADFINRVEKVLQYYLGGIKHNIVYPSITDACKSCPYKEICSW